MTSLTQSLNLQFAAVSVRNFYILCKPRVTGLIVFTAVIGMLLAMTPETSWVTLLAATVGIGLASGAAAAFNCMVEQQIDARMQRTRHRPTARGDVTTPATLLFAMLTGVTGLAVLHTWVNDLTMWLTLATFVGYAVVYTIFLKPATPQNIVIGGASGAMPPVLGWAAVTGTVTPEALVLFLIIFLWTPPHFWALALYRRDDYAKVDMPMLPVTHGEKVTLVHIVGYTVMLALAAFMPVTMGMAGWVYLAAAVVLNGLFLGYAIRLYQHYTDALSREMFRYSIVYLAATFAALLVDRALA
ncbi:MAG: protoheme IX farnesyltransferase [Rhodocyclaceae bacterium]|nr:protoheme IX farnesyltransferase [Rhodocyclaceae bacterium]